jgi:outer membrane protein assembly factor BamB
MLITIFRPAALLALLASTVIAADWNQWRGSRRDGTAPGFNAPRAWSASSLVKRWAINVGEGHSSPLLVGDQAFVFARENDQEVLRCVALRDGKVLWLAAQPAPYRMNLAARGHGKGPKSTPAVVDGRVFTFGINGQLSAHDARTGAVLWRKDFARDYPSTAPDFGASASPIVEGGHVIIHVGGEDRGALTAFDVATGNARWKWEGDGPGYTSPIIATIGGIRQLITQSQEYCLAVHRRTESCSGRRPSARRTIRTS